MSSFHQMSTVVLKVSPKHNIVILSYKSCELVKNLVKLLNIDYK
jgi:hypothetical protein